MIIDKGARAKSNVEALSCADRYVRRYGATCATVEMVSQFFETRRHATEAVSFLSGKSDVIPAWCCG